MRSLQVKTVRFLACLVAGILLALASSRATTAPVGKGFGFAYDTNLEVTITGIVRQLVTHNPHGSPLGLHVILISSSGATVDAHVGQLLAKQIQQTLHVGEPVQVIGVHEKVHGKDVLLARQLTFGGRQVTVRNAHGFLINTASLRGTAKGGIQ